MISIITILILLACVVLGFFILIQNPKGGGLTGSFGTMSSAVMGVKQSTDVMEKGTWTLIGIIGGLCIVSVMFFQKPATIEKGNAAQQKSAPAKSGK
jgi:preprotein translocase subunit SecG